MITPRMLADVHRTLVPGGLFVVQTDNPDYWSYMARVLPEFFAFREHPDPWPDVPLRAGRVGRSCAAAQDSRSSAARRSAATIWNPMGFAALADSLPSADLPQPRARYHLSAGFADGARIDSIACRSPRMVISARIDRSKPIGCWTMPKFHLPKLTMTTDIVIFTIRGDRLEVLLIQRGNPPFQGNWALPGGLVEEDEDLDVCAGRELEEETGVRDVSLEQVHTYGAPQPGPARPIRHGRL